MFNTDLWSLVTSQNRTNSHNHMWPSRQGLVNNIYTHRIKIKPFKKHQCFIIAADPFGGDPFKEADPFKASSEDFFKKTTKMDPFSTADPFSKSATLPTKVPAHSEDWSQSKTKNNTVNSSTTKGSLRRASWCHDNIWYSHWKSEKNSDKWISLLFL